jgi:predicted membrane metal-binding protein
VGWKILGVFLLSLFAMYRQIDVANLKVSVIQHLDRLVQVKTESVLGRKEIISKGLIERTWLDLHSLQIPLKPTIRCPQKTQKTWIGVFELTKPLGGWNTPIFRAGLDAPKIKFKCIGWINQGLGEGSFFEPFHQFRSRVQAYLKKRIAPTWGGDILYSLLTGDKRRITAQGRHFLQLTFIWHICVISGMHVAFVFSFLMWIWKWLSFPIRFRYSFFALSLDGWVRWGIAILFVSWWGGSPSAWRGLGFYFLVIYLERSKSILHKWLHVILGCSVLLIIKPELGHSIGFWMSVYAGIQFSMCNHLFRKLSFFPRFILTALFMNFCMLPWILYLSGLVAWPWLFFSPISVILVFIQGSSAGLATLIPGLTPLNEFSNQWLINLSEWVYQWPSSFFIKQYLSWEVLCLWCVTLYLCFALYIQFKHKKVMDL